MSENDFSPVIVLCVINTRMLGLAVSESVTLTLSQVFEVIAETTVTNSSSQ